MNPNPPAIVHQFEANKMAGVASWYGERHRGKRMANGEKFNPDDPTTCACWHFPLGTRLRVTSQNTGASVDVVVKDRGPNKRLGRLIDLSKSAFDKIYPTHFGLDDVVVEVIP